MILRLICVNRRRKVNIHSFFFYYWKLYSYSILINLTFLHVQLPCCALSILQHLILIYRLEVHRMSKIKLVSHCIAVYLLGHYEEITVTSTF